MRYFLWIDDKKHGPYESEQIRRMLDKGEVAPVTLAAAEDGTDKWTPTHLPGLVGPTKLPAGAARPYFIDQNGETKGPYTIRQLQSMWNAGGITGRTMYCQEEDSEWRALSTIVEQLEAPAASAVTQPSVVLVKATKSRGVYIILGLFFGLLGIHNFYAGHNRAGAWQLVITLTLGWVFIGLIVSGIWALADICTVALDGDGQRMT
jgi:TM2 domain-containing membrane protein YozV